MRIKNINISFWTTVFVRISTVSLIFTCFVLWSKDIASVLVMWVLICFIFLYTIILPLFRNLANREVVSLKGRMRAIEIALQTRVRQWSLIHDTLVEHKGFDPTLWEELRRKNVLNTRSAISVIIDILGKDFRDEVRRRSRFKQDVKVRVAYFQIQKGRQNSITIRHPENIFVSDVDKNSEIEPTDWQQISFTENDGSTAGLAWHLREAIFVSDTLEELRKGENERRFMKIRKGFDQKSIACLPIGIDEKFFGVLSFNCNVPNIIQETNSFKASFLQDFSPIIKHLTLMEIIRSVYDIFWERLDELEEGMQENFVSAREI